MRLLRGWGDRSYKGEEVLFRFCFFEQCDCAMARGFFVLNYDRRHNSESRSLDFFVKVSKRDSASVSELLEKTWEWFL
jgi:hypothetical protein